MKERLQDLVFAERVNEVGIDVADGDAKEHDNQILGHSFSK